MSTARNRRAANYHYSKKGKRKEILSRRIKEKGTTCGRQRYPRVRTRADSDNKKGLRLRDCLYWGPAWRGGSGFSTSSYLGQLRYGEAGKKKDKGSGPCGGRWPGGSASRGTKRIDGAIQARGAKGRVPAAQFETFSKRPAMGQVGVEQGAAPKQGPYRPEEKRTLRKPLGKRTAKM